MRIYYLLPLIIIFFSGFPSNEKNKKQLRPFAKPYIERKWSGSMTFVEHYEGKTGHSTRTIMVSFKNALPTLFRNDTTSDLNFTDDKGTGTVNYTAESIIEGKKIGKTDCTGNDYSELHQVIIDLEDSIYHIEAVGPACNGETISYLAGDPEPVRKYGPERTSISVSDQPLGSNPNFLSGSKTTESDIVGMGRVRSTITWNLWSGPLDAELIVLPDNYDNWMPIAGADELRKGNVIDILLKVQKKNGQPSPLKVGRFEVTLSNTSTEKGITLNMPVDPSADQLPDIRILPARIGESIDDGQFIDFTSTDGKTGMVTLASYDGGGWTTLKAVAVMENGMRIDGMLLRSGGVTEIPIPKRDPSSKIAKAWLIANNNPADTDDKENTPGVHKGDGLSAYEEYRGVIGYEKKGTNIEGPKFFRLDPKKKEVGVQFKRSNISTFIKGFNLFEGATTVKSILFSEAEIGSDRRMNNNGANAQVYKQYVLKIDTGATSKNAAGENRPVTLDFMVPRQSELIVINVSWIDEFYPAQVAAVPPGSTMPYTKDELLANTVAHELAHGINVNHHGNRSFTPQGRTAYEDSNPAYHIYDQNFREIPISRWRFDAALNKRYYNIEGLTGIRIPGNEESGDLNCIMAYTSYYQWSFVLGANGSLHYHMVPLLAPGKILCKSPNATGINIKPQFFGNAGTGISCESQIKLKD